MRNKVRKQLTTSILYFGSIAIQNRYYLLTPWNRVFLEKLTGSAASQETPRIFGTRKVPHRTHKCPPSVHTLSQLHPVPTTPFHFPKIHINIILQSTSGSPQWSLSIYILRLYIYTRLCDVLFQHTASLNGLCSFFTQRRSLRAQCWVRLCDRYNY